MNSRRRPTERGGSLIEIVLALTIFSLAVLGLARAGFVTSQTLRSGHSYTIEWTVAQSKLDSLTALGWTALDGEQGRDTVRGYQVSWDVQDTDPRRIILVIQRSALARTSADTFTTYVANVP